MGSTLGGAPSQSNLLGGVVARLRSSLAGLLGQAKQ